VVTANSPAASAGIQPGDRIISIADHTVDTWEQFLNVVMSRPNREASVHVIRDGRDLELRVTPLVQSESRFEIGDIGVMPDVHPHVRSVSAGEPAEKAGLKTGDLVLAVNEEPISFSTQLRDAIAKHPQQTIKIAILRDGQRQTIEATPRKSGTQGWLGIGIGDETKTVQP
jgi:regulator of sigma E protease